MCLRSAVKASVGHKASLVTAPVLLTSAVDGFAEAAEGAGEAAPAHLSEAGSR